MSHIEEKYADMIIIRKPEKIVMFVDFGKEGIKEFLTFPLVEGNIPYPPICGEYVIKNVIMKMRFPLAYEENILYVNHVGFCVPLEDGITIKKMFRLE